MKLDAVFARDRLVQPTKHLENGGWQAGPSESILQGTKLIKDTPQGPDITFTVVWFVVAYFWGEVARSANHSTGKVCGTELLGDAWKRRGVKGVDKGMVVQ